MKVKKEEDASTRAAPRRESVEIKAEVKAKMKWMSPKMNIYLLRFSVHVLHNLCHKRHKMMVLNLI